MRLRDRWAGALLLLALLLFCAGGLSRFAPDAWPGSELPRIAETLAPWLLALGLAAALGAAALGALWSGAALALCCVGGAAGLAAVHLGVSQPLSAPPPAGEARLRVLFFNVLYTNAANAEAIARMAIREDPEIVIFAEAEGVAPAAALLKAHFPYAPDCGARFCPLQVYSRLEPLEARYRSFNPLASHAYFRGLFEVEGRRAAIAGVHLLKPWFPRYARRERGHLARRIREETAPLLLTGDFNAPTWSRALSSFLKETDLRAPRLPAATWPAALGPLGVPIDHALVGNGMRLISLDPVGEGLGSNHRGLLATLAIGPAE